MMTMDKMKEFARLFDCELIEYENTVELSFDSFTVRFDRHFELGMTEARMFAVMNFLKPLREAIDNDIFNL